MPEPYSVQVAAELMPLMLAVGVGQATQRRPEEKMNYTRMGGDETSIMSAKTSPDSICAKFSERRQRITVGSLGDDTVLLEGSAEAPELFGKLLIAQARFKQDCSFEISPNGPGSALFSGDSTLGLYIHRLPCMHKEKA